MHPLEKLAINVRRSPLLRKASPLWSLLRPGYLQILKLLGKGHLVRNINGTDSILIVPELYILPEHYEPEVWRAIMGEAKVGDIIADVGAHMGLYTVALAKRVGAAGRVYAFEPDKETADLLHKQVRLNRVQDRVDIVTCAVGKENGEISFASGRGSESHVVGSAQDKGIKVMSHTLDSLFTQGRLDILKIDVEGFEEHVLCGASSLLRNSERAPRAIFVEVHPHAWHQYGVSSNSLLSLLRDYGYSVCDLAGLEITNIARYGEIVARRS